MNRRFYIHFPLAETPLEDTAFYNRADIRAHLVDICIFLYEAFCLCRDKFPLTSGHDRSSGKLPVFFSHIGVECLIVWRVKATHKSYAKVHVLPDKEHI